MKRLILAVLLGTLAHATSLTGTLNAPGGVGLNGTLRMAITSQGAVQSTGSCSGPWIVVPGVEAVFTVTNGSLAGGASVVGNDCVLPLNTLYNVRFIDSNANVLFNEQWSIIGASIDVGTIVPVTSPPSPLSLVQQQQLSYGAGMNVPLGFLSSATDPTNPGSSSTVTPCYFNTASNNLRCYVSGSWLTINANITGDFGVTGSISVGGTVSMGTPLAQSSGGTGTTATGISATISSIASCPTFTFVNGKLVSWLAGC